MTLHRSLSLSILALVLTVSSTARADDTNDHFEFSMGFLAGRRAYDGANFTLADGQGGKTGPWLPADVVSGGPFDSVDVYGLHWEVRLVLSYVRLTTGLDIPFSMLGPGGRTHSYGSGDSAMTLGVESIQPYELRLGLGGEVPIGPVAIFADLMGGVHWTTATVVTADDVVAYETTQFTLAPRVGVRVHVQDWLFVEGAGEVGVLGDTVFTTTLSVGFATE